MPIGVYLKAGEQKRILAGHSWVYANQVARIEGKGANGSLATVYSADGKFVGKGYINHLSKLLVRIFIRDEQEDDSPALYAERIKKADDMRRRIGCGEAYRMVFAEADDLPALIVDRYGDVLVTQFLSLGVDKRKEMIASVLNELFRPACIYERSDVPVRRKEGLDEVKGVLLGALPDNLVITENGVKLNIDVQNGQKTGYFLDQSANRLAIRRYCGGDVLDCFCNSGGFSLNAAKVANSVTSVDISQTALDNVQKNAALNGFDNIIPVKGDAFELLRQFRAENKKFDAVILDPPAFCKSVDEVQSALKGYLDINMLGMKLVKDGGFLTTASCSQHISAQQFERMLQDAARMSRRSVKVLEQRTQAPDHPAPLQMGESSYLKFFVLQVN